MGLHDSGEIYCHVIALAPYRLAMRIRRRVALLRNVAAHGHSGKGIQSRDSESVQGATGRARPPSLGEAALLERNLPLPRMVDCLWWDNRHGSEA